MMTNVEVNKVISEYMRKSYGSSVGNTNPCPVCAFEPYLLYTESLDSLIPPWERLGRYAACGKQESQGFQATMLPTTVSNMASVYSMPSIQEAAAHATAKAIMALGEQ
tara:strand:+ start:279 stop:602 length:324 start_codon:yes stop_codon:yes gene_type:complete